MLALLIGFVGFLQLFAHHAKAQEQLEQSSVAVFQFVADSIDVVGVEDDLSYLVRNELRKAENISLVNPRELELTLARNDIQQKFSEIEALKAADMLNIPYVVIGKVSRAGQTIIANIQVISSRLNSTAGDLTFRFNSKSQINLRAERIGNEIVDLMIFAQSAAEQVAAADDWVADINATYLDNQVNLTWQLIDPNTDFLGFNIYRAQSESGPFSYLSSEAEASFVDDLADEQGDLFYQVSLIDENGEELRSNQIAKVTVEQQVQSSLSAPTVVETTKYINKLSVDFFPSSENLSQNVLGYELVRRSPQAAWEVVRDVEYGFAEQRSAQQSKRADTTVYYL